jgi:hypothetical protein
VVELAQRNWQVAQLVECLIVNQVVGGSIPPLSANHEEAISMAHVSKVTAAKVMDDLAAMLESMPGDVEFFYTKDDDGVYFRVDTHEIHLGFDMETAIKNLRIEAVKLKHDGE